MSNVANMVSEYSAKVKKMQDELSSSMKDMFKEFFEEKPEVGCLVWTQYTPYWNDGEECTFGRHEMMAGTVEDVDALKGGEIDLYDLEAPYSNDGVTTSWSSSPNEPLTEEEQKAWKVNKAAKEFVSAVGEIPEEIFKATFGDHVMVIATRDGFEVIEYDHE